MVKKAFTRYVCLLLRSLCSMNTGRIHELRVVQKQRRYTYVPLRKAIDQPHIRVGDAAVELARG